MRNKTRIIFLKTILIFIVLLAIVNKGFAQGEILYDLPDDIIEMFNDSSPGSPSNFMSEVFQGHSVVKIWTRSFEWDRVKLATQRRDFTEGRYIWKIYIPQMGTGDQTSVGAFMYMDDKHELDFECGYGQSKVRKEMGIDTDPDKIVCYMTSQDYPYSTAKIAINHSQWHVFEIKLSNIDNHYEARWYIDGQEVRKPLSLEYGPSYSNSKGEKFGIHISVENLTFLGDHIPYTTNAAYFDFIKFVSNTLNRGTDYFIYSELDTGVTGSYGVAGFVGPDGIDRIIFYSNNLDSDSPWATSYIYKVTIPPGTNPNTHPDNPHAPGPIAPRTFTLERTFPLHNQDYGHDHEFFVGQDGFYLGAAWGADGIEHYDWDGTYLGKVVNIPAPGWPQSLTFDGINTWYAGDGGWFGPDQERVVYKFIMGQSTVWEEAFRYVSGDTDMAHHDGMEYIDGKLFLADYTGDYILVFDPNSVGLVEPLEVYYHQPLSHELEALGYGALNHFWAGSHGSIITEFGGGSLQGVPTGPNITVSASPTVTVTFDLVLTTGNISGVMDPNPPQLPSGFNQIGPAYDIIFTGSFDGQIEVCLSYDDSDLTNSEDTLKLFHYNDQVWKDITSSLDTDSNIICGITDSLSPFVVAEPEVTAVPGDLDGDGDVDRDDVNQVQLYRNQPASACPECDIDGDGTITVLDARKIMLMCTCPRCICP